MNSEDQKALIVGLGNPSLEYLFTRHNFGQMILFAFAKKHLLSFEREKGLKGKIAKGDWKKRQFLLLFPITYMNLSGESVRKTMNFYKITLENILILSDDVYLPFETIRFKKKGKRRWA